MPSINDNALTTLANLKTYLGVSGDAEDSLFIFLINSATSWIESVTGRTFKKNTYTEYVRGHNTPDLFLKHYPIIGDVALSENKSSDTSDDFEAVDRNDFWVNDMEGSLEANGWFFKNLPRAYKAVYEAGYKVQGATVTGENIKLPEDLEVACCRLVAGIYNQRKAEGTSNQSLGDYSVQFQNLVKSDPILEQVLFTYRRPML